MCLRFPVGIKRRHLHFQGLWIPAGKGLDLLSSGYKEPDGLYQRVPSPLYTGFSDPSEGHGWSLVGGDQAAGFSARSAIVGTTRSRWKLYPVERLWLEIQGCLQWWDSPDSGWTGSVWPMLPVQTAVRPQTMVGRIQCKIWPGCPTLFFNGTHQ